MERLKRMWLWAQSHLAILAQGRKGLGGITLASFLETTIIPVPIEVIIAPIMASSRKRGFIVANVTLLGSVLGGFFLYGLAFGLFDQLAKPLIHFLGAKDSFDEISKQFRDDGFWVVFTVSISPAPMQIAALAAGATQYSFWPFALAIIASRAIRYYGLWLLVLLFGSGIARIFAGKKPKDVKPAKTSSTQNNLGKDR